VIDEFPEVIDESAEVIDEFAEVIDEFAEVIDESTEVIDEFAEVIDESAEVIDESAEVIDESAEVIDEFPEVIDCSEMESTPLRFTQKTLSHRRGDVRHRPPHVTSISRYGRMTAATRQTPAKCHSSSIVNRCCRQPSRIRRHGHVGPDLAAELEAVRDRLRANLDSPSLARDSPAHRALFDLRNAMNLK
jgi:hypothetical protein